jgi:hypothetical protein
VPTFSSFFFAINQAEAHLSQAAAAQIHPTTINEEYQVFPLLSPPL